MSACSYDATIDPQKLTAKQNDDADPNAASSTYTKFQVNDKVAAYGDRILPVLQANCARCHGKEQSPKHSVTDRYAAFKAGEKFINFEQPDQSQIYKRPKFEEHNCKPNCAAIAASLLQAIQAFKADLLAK